MFSHFEMTLSVPELIKRTAHEAMSDDAQGLASQLAYYFFWRCFPHCCAWSPDSINSQRCAAKDRGQKIGDRQVTFVDH